MKDLASYILLTLFALLPPSVLATRMRRPSRMPWWAAFGLVIGLGWLLILGGALIKEGPESGAGHVTALFAGWAFALIWFLPWLGLYAIIHLIRSKSKTKKGSGEDS